MKRRKLSEQIERSETAMRLTRAAFDRNGQAFERLMATFARHEEIFERLSATLDRHEEQSGDLRVFIRDMNRRSEKVLQDLCRHREELMATQAKRTEENLVGMKDAREESRAQRQALLALIDRLSPSKAA